MVDYEFIKTFSDLRQVGVVLLLWMDQNTHTTESIVEQFGNDGKMAIADLIAHGRLFVDDDNFLVLNTAKKMTATEEQVEAFRKAYPGTKPSAEKFMELLKKKKKWRDIVPQLMPGLERDQKHKRWLAANNKLCPDFPLLTVWMNQDRYTWEYDTPESVVNDDSLYGKYLAHRAEHYPSCTSLSGEQFSAWVSKTGIFSQISSVVPPEQHKSWFWEKHSKNTYDTMKTTLEK